MLRKVRELKARHPGTVLMVQSGYKMLFFEEDAKVCLLVFSRSTRAQRHIQDCVKGAGHGVLSETQPLDFYDPTP